MALMMLILLVLALALFDLTALRWEAETIDGIDDFI